MTDPFKTPVVTLVQNPFDTSSRTVMHVLAGKTVRELVVEAFPQEERGIEVVATVNGEVVENPRESDRRLGLGDMMVVCAKIMGGGDTGKAIVRTVAMIAVMAAAIFVPPALGLALTTFGGALMAASISIGGALLINALLPAQQTQLGGMLAEPTQSNTYGWTPSQNQIVEGLALPIVYGTMLATPMIISKYVTTDGERQKLNVLYALAEGPIQTIASIKINDNAIANYTDVTTVTRPGDNSGVNQTWIDGFERTTSEKVIGQVLENNDYRTNVTDGNVVTTLGFGLVFPSGLAKVTGNDIGEHTVNIEIGYKLTSEPTTWTSQVVSITGNKMGTIRKAYEYSVAAGEYDVRVAFRSARQTGVDYVEACTWEYLQESVTADDFVYPNTALLGIQALATDHLNGVNPRVTCVLTKGNVSVWTGAAYADKPSNNPAWACYDLLHNSRYGAGIPVSRLTYAEFNSWASFCTTNSYEVNIILDTAMSLSQALAKVGTAGRGMVVQRGTKFGAMWDGTSTPVQLFTVGNILANSFEESYLDRANRADVIEITFLDAANDYERRTIEVAASGFDSSTAEIRMTQIGLDGVTSWAQAAKYGKFLMNCQQYLMRTITFGTDVDAITCQPGDVISVQHDVPQWGYGGRVVSATSNTITFDRTMSVTTGTTYVVLVRLSASDTLVTKTLANPGTGSYTTFSLATGTWTTTPAADDVYSFGVENVETKDFRVLSIKRKGDQTCQITAMEYRAEVYSDAVTLPEYPVASDLPQVDGVRADDIYPVGPDGERRAPYIDVTWRGFAVLWNVFVKESVEGIWRRVAQVNRTGYKVTGVDMGKTYTVAVSVTDNPEDGDSDTVIMTIDPPEAIPSLTAEALDNFVLLRWGVPTSELPVAYYDVMRGDTLATAQSVGRADKTFTTVMERLAGTYTYWVYAVDTAGNTGTASSVTITLTLPTDYEQAGTFTGNVDENLVNFEIMTDGILGPINTTETWTEHFVNNNQTTFQGFIDAGYTYYFQPNTVTTGSFEEGSTDMGATIANASVVLTVDWFALTGNPSSVVLTPTLSSSLDGVAWTDYAGVWMRTVSNFRYIKYHIDVTCDADTEIVVRSATITLVLRKVEESGSAAVADANNGKAITFTTPFVDVHSINVTPLYDAAKRLHAVYDFTDVPNPTGFTVYLYDEVTAAKTTGSFSYIVKGV
jgi:predicted phage tail protein